MTSNWTSTNIAYFDGGLNNGMGSVVGVNTSEDATKVENCFTIIAEGGSFSADNVFANGNGITAVRKTGTNCGVYSSISALRTAQASALANMSIAKYIAG